METTYDIRSSLIEKILTIKNESFLQALEQLIDSSNTASDLIETSPEQKIMLEMSEDDIENGRLISQEAMTKRNMEWLNGM